MLKPEPIMCLKQLKTNPELKFSLFWCVTNYIYLEIWKFGMQVRSNYICLRNLAANKTSEFKPVVAWIEFDQV